MPEIWFDEPYAAKRQACGVPADPTFQTKPEIGLALLRHTVECGTLSFQWVAADALYGDAPVLRDGVADLGKWYFAEIRCTTLLWRSRPEVHLPPWQGRGRRPTRLRVRNSADQPVCVSALATALPRDAWTTAAIKEGSKGPIVCNFACLRVTELTSSASAACVGPLRPSLRKPRARLASTIMRCAVGWVGITICCSSCCSSPSCPNGFLMPPPLCRGCYTTRSAIIRPIFRIAWPNSLALQCSFRTVRCNNS